MARCVALRNPLCFPTQQPMWYRAFTTAIKEISDTYFHNLEGNLSKTPPPSPVLHGHLTPVQRIQCWTVGRQFLHLRAQYSLWWRDLAISPDAPSWRQEQKVYWGLPSVPLTGTWWSPQGYAVTGLSRTSLSFQVPRESHRHLYRSRWAAFSHHSDDPATPPGLMS